MSDSFVLLELAGHVGLLLWGTHMVTSGVQRGFGAELRHWLGRNLQQRWRAFLVGLGMTALLQSSTATGLMATSFTVCDLRRVHSRIATFAYAALYRVGSLQPAPEAPDVRALQKLREQAVRDENRTEPGEIAGR